jgi:AhpD family alkylhydroperoxidase
MSAFVVHTAQTAPAPAGEKLAQIGKNWGFVPNLHGILAESPETLDGYDALFGLVAKTTLTPVEQQVAFLAVNYENECEYCMAGHSVLAGMAKVPAATIEALREGGTIADSRLEALHGFVAKVVRQRGAVGDAAVAEFLAAGFTARNVLEVVLIVATKTISNYTNHIARTPNDAFMANTAWIAPSRRAAEAA